MYKDLYGEISYEEYESDYEYLEYLEDLKTGKGGIDLIGKTEEVEIW